MCFWTLDTVAILGNCFRVGMSVSFVGSILLLLLFFQTNLHFNFSKTSIYCHRQEWDSMDTNIYYTERVSYWLQYSTVLFRTRPKFKWTLVRKCVVVPLAQKWRKLHFWNNFHNTKCLEKFLDILKTLLIFLILRPEEPEEVECNADITILYQLLSCLEW